MAIDFPNSPSSGALYTAGGKTWQWNGTYWAAYGTGPVLRTSDTPPASPNAGDLWYETDTGRFFTYIDSAWVEIGNATDVAGALQPSQVTALSAVTTLTSDDIFPVVDGPSSAVASSKITADILASQLTQFAPQTTFRNKIINGDFGIWQRGGTGGYTPNSGAMEGADRWITWWNGTGGTRSVSRSTFTLGQTAVPDNPKHHMTINTSVIGSGQGVTDFWQKIENVNTFAGQTATLSFWWKSTSAATQVGPFITQNFGTGGSPSTAVDTFLTGGGLASANTWTRYSVAVTLPSISGKTLGTSNDHLFLGIRFLISVACTIDISSVQLERGSVATPFEQRPIQQELALCQRYYEKSYNYDVTPGTSTIVGAYGADSTSHGDNTSVNTITFKVTKRVTPTTVTFWSTGGTLGSWAYQKNGLNSTTTVVSYAPGMSGMSPYISIGAAWIAAFRDGHWAVEAEL